MAEVLKILIFGEKIFPVISCNQNSFPDFCDNEMSGLGAGVGR